MKTKLLLIPILLIAGMAWGQEKITNDFGLDITSTEEKVDSLSNQEKSEEKKSEEKKLEDVIRKVITENKDAKTAIGKIVLKTKTIIYEDKFTSEIKKLNNKKTKEVNNMLHTLYLKLLTTEKLKKKKYESLTIEILNDKSNVSYTTPIVKIDSVKFDINEGMLEFIKVYLKDGTTYTNRKAPVSLVHLDERGNDRLYNSDGDKFVLIKNVVSFDSDKRFGYLPDDQKFSLNNNDDKNPGKLSLTKNGDINSLVNFTAYSDFLGLLGDEPNAILNLETNAKFYLHRKNMSDNFSYLFSTFQPHFHYNKIDSKFDSITINNNVINPTEIFRRYNFAVGFDLSIFKWDWRPANSFEIKVGYLFTSSKVYINEQRTNGINHIKYLEANLKSKVIDNFGIDLNAKYMWQHLNENQYFDNIREKMLSFRGGIYFASPKAKGDDKIFLRFTNYLIFDNREQDFSQIQVGFTKSLNF